MTRHFDQRAIERAAVILRVAERYSGDELDARSRRRAGRSNTASKKPGPEPKRRAI
jgi:hypothetical protein